MSEQEIRDTSGSFDEDASETKAPQLQITEKSSNKYAPYHCLYPGCAKKFRRSKDLTRHVKIHNSDAKFFRCGCCLNGCCHYKQNTRVYNGTVRRDKLQSHMRNIHHAIQNDIRSCSQNSCCQEDELLFSQSSCLNKHRRQEHDIDMS